MQVPELQNGAGANLFPNSTLFPNLALHLRMGLPWRGDFYLRLADATIPAGYKISPTMTAQVQTNSVGAGIRQHLFGGEYPVLTLGAHFNHVQGYTKLSGTYGVSSQGFTANDLFGGEIAWDVQSYGLSAVVSKSFDGWTPFAGIGYNYTTGSVNVNLDLQSGTFLIPNITGQGVTNAERNQGREMAGVSYDRPTWSFFADAELKALGALQYRSWIAQFGFALPFDIGRTASIISMRRGDSAAEPAPDADSEPAAEKPARRSRPAAPQPDQSPSGLIFLK